MATAKQYELLFLLKAQMDSALGSNFTGVKKYIADLQGKLKDYNNTLRDISAYRTQAQKIEELTQKYQNEGKSITEIDSLLEKKKQKLAETAEALEKAGVSTGNLTEEEKKLAQAVQETTAEMEKWADLQNTVTNFANTLTGLQPAADMVVNAVKGIDDAIISCIGSAGELQYTMSAVSAVSGATAEETEALTALAKETGATTIYTAEQAAQALETMGLAGMSAQQMMSGLPGVVKLAAASGEDLTEMCSIVSDALNAFGLSGTEAVNEFADTLAKAATSSNTNVSVLGESLSYVESTAANLGYSIQDVSIALAQMANNALKGSVSGSALNTMLTRMSGANETAASEMDALGLSMYNADGSAKELSVFLDELRTAFQSFGDDAQAAQVAAYKLAGQRGMRGLLSIVQASDEEWEKLSDAIYDYNGAAGEISDIRLDNYTGQIYLLESAWDALKTTIGEAYLPVATDAAETLTNLTDEVNDLASEHQNLLVVLSASATTIGGTAAGFSVLATAAQIAKFALEAMSIELLPIVGTGLAIGGVAAAFAGFAAAVVQGTGSMEGVPGTVNKVRNSVNDLTETLKTEEQQWEETAAKYEEHREKADALVDSLEKLQNEEQDNKLTQQEIAETVKQLNELLPDLDLEYDKTKGTISATTKEVREFADAVSPDEMEDTLSELANKRAELTQAEANLQEAQAASAVAKNELNYGRHDVYHKFVNTAVYNNAIAAEKEAQAVYDETKAKVSELEEKTDSYNQALEEQAQKLGLSNEQLTVLKDAVTEYEKVWGDAYNTVYEALQGQISLFSEADEITKTSTDELYGNLESQYERLKSYQENLQTLADAGITFPEGMWEQLTNGSSEAQGAVAALAKDVKNNNTSAVESVINKWNEVSSLIDTTSGTAANTLESVQTALDEVVEAVDFNGGELKGQAITAGENVISGLTIGINEGGTKVKGSATKATNDMMNAIRTAAGVHSPSTITTDVGKDVDQGLINGLNAKKEAIAKMAKEVATSTINGFKNKLKYDTFKGYGKDAIQGAIDGATSKRKILIDTFTKLARDASEAYADALDINSPSKLFSYYSEMTIEGGAQGTEKNKDKLTAAYSELATAGAEAYRTTQEAILINPLALEVMGAYSDRTSSETDVMPLSVTNYGADYSRESEAEQFVFAPNITVTGSGGEMMQEIKDQLQEQAGEFFNTLERYLQQREDRNRRRVR